MTAKEILKQLNETDELTHIEAKSAGEASRPVMESVCAFANEPGLEGGYILLGVKKDETLLIPQYVIEEISNPDKLQSDLATQCASMFNLPVRPDIKVEKVNEKHIVLMRVAELPPEQKPLYFKNESLPRGAYRRIGPTDHRCTEDDMSVFYSDQKSYDQSIQEGTSINDIDESALKRYRSLREKANAAAEELAYSDEELLISLGCMDHAGSGKLTVAGLLLFGKSSSLRRIFPMLRVDYIRVPGTDWVSDPDNRFDTIDMRGPLILLLFRLVDAIYADLPKGFRLESGEIQAQSVGIPVKALREAVTNALMHRSYREQAPIQVIRYDNRVEIKNPGFSLKSQDKLGAPGSQPRNPHIAAVFHETNLAETKGSGIRAMRELLKKSHMAPPTFESDRDNNAFTLRLLLHHFFGPEDFEWLAGFDRFNLNDQQKIALLFVRETGAIDNNTYRQIADADTLKASSELRGMRDYGLLTQKGKGRSTYYIPGAAFLSNLQQNDTDITEGARDITDGTADITEGARDITDGTADIAVHKLPEEIAQKLKAIGKKAKDKGIVEDFIIALCAWKPHTLAEIAGYLKKKENHISREYIKPLIDKRRLDYTIPEMKKHPQQAYKTIHG